MEGSGSAGFILLVYLIYLPLSVLIPSSSGVGVHVDDSHSAVSFAVYCVPV